MGNGHRLQPFDENAKFRCTCWWEDDAGRSYQLDHKSQALRRAGCSAMSGDCTNWPLLSQTITTTRTQQDENGCFHWMQWMRRHDSTLLCTQICLPLSLFCWSGSKLYLPCCWVDSFYMHDMCVWWLPIVHHTIKHLASWVLMCIGGVLNILN